MTDLRVPDPRWNRLAAATGAGFVVLAVTISILAEIKNYPNIGHFALQASDQMWASVTLLTGAAAVLFFWFTGILATRLRQIERASGTSGRLAAVVFGAGTIIAGVVALQVGVQFTARQLGPNLGLPFATFGGYLFAGPTLAFPIAAFIGAAGLVAIRASGLPRQSEVLGMLSLPIAAAYIGLGGLQIFQNYAWIDETGQIVFLAWVLALSVIGIQRWGEIDVGFTPVIQAPPPAPPAVTEEVSTPAATAKPARKAAKRKPARKAPARRAAPKKGTRKR